MLGSRGCFILNFLHRQQLRTWQITHTQISLFSVQSSSSFFRKSSKAGKAAFLTMVSNDSANNSIRTMISYTTGSTLKPCQSANAICFSFRHRSWESVGFSCFRLIVACSHLTMISPSAGTLGVSTCAHICVRADESFRCEWQKAKHEIALKRVRFLIFHR